MQTRRRSILGAYRAALEPAGLRFVPEIEDPGSADHLAAVSSLWAVSGERLATMATSPSSPSPPP